MDKANKQWLPWSIGQSGMCIYGRVHPPHRPFISMNILHRRCSSCRCMPDWHWSLDDIFSFLGFACSLVSLSFSFSGQSFDAHLPFVVVDASYLFCMSMGHYVALNVVLCMLCTDAWHSRFVVSHPIIANALATLAWTRFLILLEDPHQVIPHRAGKQSKQTMRVENITNTDLIANHYWYRACCEGN